MRAAGLCGLVADGITGCTFERERQEAEKRKWARDNLPLAPPLKGASHCTTPALFHRHRSCIKSVTHHGRHFPSSICYNRKGTSVPLQPPQNSFATGVRSKVLRGGFQGFQQCGSILGRSAGRPSMCEVGSLAEMWLCRSGEDRVKVEAWLWRSLEDLAKIWWMRVIVQGWTKCSFASN